MSLNGDLRAGSSSLRGPLMLTRMEPTRCAVLVVLCCRARAVGDKLQITSTPAGAMVELDGVAAGVTPFEKDFPGGYLHKTRTSMGSRLEHPLVASIRLAGYTSKEVKLTSFDEDVF